MKSYKHYRTCRVCGSNQLSKVIDLGKTPASNAFLKPTQLSAPEPSYPLRTYFCNRCNLLQLCDVVSPKILFRNYVYVSSTSPVFITHFQEFADSLISRFNLSSSSLVIDVGSNDGILLKPFQNKSIRVLGIEPATNIAELARKQNVTTINQFFSIELAKMIRNKYGPADLITATNVFAHINDIHEVAEGVKLMLSSSGVFVIEAPYLVNLLQQNLFDTIYHEHLSYFAVKPLQYFFQKHNMFIFDVELTSSHGGSLRVYISQNNAEHKIEPSVKQFIQNEQNLGLDKKSSYTNFAKRVTKNKRDLVSLLTGIKKQGKTISAYGAPAKGNTLLNYFGINNKIIDYIVEDSKYKQGLFTPGTKIPIFAPYKIYKNKPDFLLILAWNFAESIMKNHKKYHKWGKFIIPVPKPRII